MSNLAQLDAQAKVAAIKDKFTLHNVNNAVISIQERFGSDVVVVDVEDLCPKSKNSIKEFLAQDEDNIEFNHTYSPDLCDKAYAMLRNENPYDFVDLSENCSELHHWSLTNSGRNACSLIQELLNGDHPFLSIRIWDKSQLVKDSDEFKPVLELDVANSFIQNATLEPLLCFDEVVLIDHEENTLTLSLNAYLVAKFGQYSEIYSRFNADFEIKENNELSVEFAHSNFAIRSEHLYLNAPLEGKAKNLVSDELEQYLDQTSVDCLTPTDQYKAAFLERFKKCMGDVTYKHLRAEYV